jgi:hypothetical protein
MASDPVIADLTLPDPSLCSSIHRASYGPPALSEPFRLNRVAETVSHHHRFATLPVSSSTRPANAGSNTSRSENMAATRAMAHRLLLSRSCGGCTTAAVIIFLHHLANQLPSNRCSRSLVRPRRFRSYSSLSRSRSAPLAASSSPAGQLGVEHRRNPRFARAFAG